MTNKIIGLVAVVALLLSGYGMFRSDTVIIEQTKNLGNAGANLYMRGFFGQGSTNGGSVSTSTGTITAYTTATSDFAGTPTTILWTPNANQTITLTATSTHVYVPNTGDVAKIYFQNASTTAASAITFAAANANVDLQFVEATGGDLVLNGLDWVEVTIIRTSLYKTAILLNEFTEAD